MCWAVQIFYHLYCVTVYFSCYVVCHFLLSGHHFRHGERGRKYSLVNGTLLRQVFSPIVPGWLKRVVQCSFHLARYSSGVVVTPCCAPTLLGIIVDHGYSLVVLAEWPSSPVCVTAYSLWRRTLSGCGCRRWS